MMHSEQIIFNYHKEKSGSKQLAGLKNWNLQSVNRTMQSQSHRKPGVPTE